MLHADETINNEMLQNQMMPSSWSQGSYYDYTSLSMETVPSCIQAQPSGHAWLNNYELPSHLNNMMIGGGYHDQEIEFNTTQSMEASLVYNYNTHTSTQFDWSMLS
jgi:hypothetical protein